ncbi:flagellar export protein FliJ [Candidatus Symbiobacter mobilis]|uniref:Flagellar FliJ protein n=1 Tax=Candidatus Symbiobacter mobilis CR TaxID=946483 RepID=U5NE20_9BURK|nr:flagellar export protein FliJ [Candidatus Symbiobacter mobilis]AGX88369.1 flagellar protein FliJ [Candidatus Symbiobacter mobilis CR]
MPRFQGLTLAIEHATVQRDKALAQWQTAVRALEHGHEQMAQLRQYAGETEQRWVHTAQESTSAPLLFHHYQFLDRLHHAIQIQEGTLQTLEQRVASAKKVVIDAEVRLAGIKTLLARREREWSQQMDRALQKETDEFAAQRALRALRAQQEEDGDNP